MFLVPNKHSSSNLSTSRTILELYFLQRANFCVSEQRVKLRVDLAFKLLVSGNTLSTIVLQMTVLTSENTVKFFALNLTACDIISLSVETTESNITLTALLN